MARGSRYALLSSHLFRLIFSIYYFSYSYLFSLSIIFRWQHQDEQQKQKYQHSSTAPHTAPLISKKHFPFDTPSSPRSVQTIQKNEALFTFDKHVDSIDGDNIRGGGGGGGGYENGGSKVIVDGNKVYYHGSSSYKCDSKISNGNGGDARYRGHDKLTMEKENACTAKHLTDDSYYNDQTYCSSYSKYSRRDGSWKSRHGSSSNKSSNSSNKATKPYPSEYAAYTKSGNTSNKKHSDDTMFPFDRATVTYDVGGSDCGGGSGGGGGSSGGGGGTSEWAKRPSYANSYYDSPSPDGNSSGDYYEKFRNAQRKSTASATSADGRALKELSRKQSLKLSKYDLPPSPSSIKSYNEHNHKFKNHISETDAFNLPIAKPNARTNSITSTDHSNSHATSTNANASTTTTTATIHGNATTISIGNHSPNNCANERNQISQFDQIASKFDKIPSKIPHDCKYWLGTQLNPIEPTTSNQFHFLSLSLSVAPHLKSQSIHSLN